ncbi:hypothetical protein Tco_0780910 [Tanacetum coccineum]
MNLKVSLVIVPVDSEYCRFGVEMNFHICDRLRLESAGDGPLVLLSSFLVELYQPFFFLKYSEEEVTETMAETMEQYMSKTRGDYGSGVARPKIEDKDNFELKD